MEINSTGQFWPQTCLIDTSQSRSDICKAFHALIVYVRHVWSAHTWVHGLHQQAFSVHKQGCLRVVNHAQYIPVHVLRHSFADTNNHFQIATMHAANLTTTFHLSYTPAMPWTAGVSHLASANCALLFFLHSSSCLELLSLMYYFRVYI